MSVKVRYQIFVSSTYLDLINTRQEVTKHILNMNHVPAGMEMFSSNGYPQWETIKKTIDSSDYYILIIGERYGSLCSDEGISFTEKEFNYAQSKGIPTLCFLSSSNYTTTKDKRESDSDKQNKLEIFRNKITTNLLCDMWNTEDELIGKVSAALYKIFSDRPGIGWIRGNTADPDNLSKLVKLMEENSILRERIKKLEEKQASERPKLSLYINDHSFEDSYLIFKLPELKEYISLQPNYSKNHISEKLTAFISEEEIEAYNSTKPTQDDIDKYHEDMRIFLFTLDNKCKFSINNSSSIKASNVEIVIHLPKELYALSGDDIKELKKPEILQPDNPTITAEENYAIKMLGSITPKRLSMISSYGTSISSLFLKNPPKISPLFDNNEAKITNINEINIQKIFSRQDSIESVRSDIYLAPKQRGLYTIKVDIICDEFPEWQYNEIRIAVK